MKGKYNGKKQYAVDTLIATPLPPPTQKINTNDQEHKL